jgi:hypothetical protein
MSKNNFLMLKKTIFLKYLKDSSTYRLKLPIRSDHSKIRFFAKNRMSLAFAIFELE